MSELLTQMRAGLTARHYSRRTEEVYCHRVREGTCASASSAARQNSPASS
jgi:hypothetical protein